MALGTPAYTPSGGSLDTDATLGPTSGIVAGTTALNATGTNQGDQLGITKNLINTLIAVETVVGVKGSADTGSHDYKIAHPTANSTSAAGVVAAAPNDVNQVYRGDAAWAVPVGEFETNAAFTWPAVGSTVPVTFISTTGMTVGMTLCFLDSGNKFVIGEVTVVTDATHSTVKNQGYAASTGSGSIATKALAWVAGPGISDATHPGLAPTPDNVSYHYLSGTNVYSMPSKTLWRWVAAIANNPPASNYAIFDTVNANGVLAFDPATLWTAVFLDVMPDGAPLGSGLTARIFWTAASATSGACVWGVKFDRANSGASFSADSYDTAATVTTTTNATAGNINLSTITITTIDSIAAGDVYRMALYRDAANASDTMAGNAQAIAIELRTASS